jgi:hypothetical protein
MFLNARKTINPRLFTRMYSTSFSDYEFRTDAFKNIHLDQDEIVKLL